MCIEIQQDSFLLVPFRDRMIITSELSMAHRTTADADDGNQILSRNGRAISSQTNLVPTVDDKSRLFMNQLFTPTSQTNLKGGWLWASRSTRESRNSPKKTETNRLGDRIFQVGKKFYVSCKIHEPICRDCNRNTQSSLRYTFCFATRQNPVLHIYKLYKL